MVVYHNHSDNPIVDACVGQLDISHFIPNKTSVVMAIYVMKIGMFCDVNSKHYNCYYGPWSIDSATRTH